MGPDFPAAHSMDTTWFAVDAKGHVGVFFSGEDGPIPSGMFQDANIFDVLRQLGEWPELDEGEDWEPEQDDYDLADETAAEFGFFVYQYIGEFNPLVLPYTMTLEPLKPVHVDQLPPAVRKLCNKVRMEKAQFPSSERLQPIESIACFYYSDEYIGYVAGDDRTVRPIPGREAKFAEFCAAFPRQYPERAAKLQFEEVGEPAAKKRARPAQGRKKRKGGDDTSA
jgi:hypothetical protein